MAPALLSKLSNSRLFRSKSSTQTPAAEDGSISKPLFQPDSAEPIKTNSKQNLDVPSDGVSRTKSLEQRPSTNADNKIAVECADLWQEAFDRLDKDCRQWAKYCDTIQKEGLWPLSANKTPNTADDVITIVDSVRTAAVRKGQSRLRRTTATVLNGLEQLSDLVAVAASTNPFSAAGWSVVSFLITAANKDNAVQDFCWSASDMLGDMLYRYQTYTTVYLQPGGSSITSADMKEALIGLFVKVLEFEVAVVVSVKSKSERLKAVFKESESQKIIEEIKNQEATIEKLRTILSRQSDVLRFEDIQRVTGQLMSSTLDVAERVHQIDTKITALRRQIDVEYRLNILDWISPGGYDKVHGAKIPMHESADWLIKGPRYEQWLLQDHARAFWLYGFMGSGKSCVVHAVVEDIKARFKREKSSEYSLMYYYCSSADVEGKLETDIVDAIFRSLLKQVADTGEEDVIHPLVLSTYLEQRPKGPLSASQCMELIPRLTTLAQRVIIVLDGIDECPVSAQRALLAQVQKLIVARNTFKVFVASRKEQSIKDGLEDLHPISFDIASQNEQAINKVVDEKVGLACSSTHKSLYVRGTHDQSFKVRDTLKKHAGGMFRWVDAALSFLHESSTFAEMADRLEKLPVCEDLYVLYDEIYGRVVQKARRSGNEVVMKTTLLLMLYGQELSSTKGESVAPAMYIVEACQFAKTGRLSTGYTASDLCENCVGFLLLDESGRLSIAHASVREYLSSRHSEFAFEVGHAQLAALCINVFKETEEQFDGKKGFKLYASAHWLTHLRQVSEVGESLQIRQSSRLLTTTENRFDMSAAVHDFLLASTTPQTYLRWTEWSKSMHALSFDWGFDSSRLLTQPPSTFPARAVLGLKWADAEFKAAGLLEVQPLDPCKQYLSSMIDLLVRARAAPVIEWLVSQGTDVNLEDQLGNTPSHLLLEPDSRFSSETLQFRPCSSTLITLKTMIGLGADMYRENTFGVIAPVVASFDRVSRIRDSADALSIYLDKGLSTVYESKQGIAMGRSLVDEIYEHTDIDKVKTEIEETVEPLLLQYAKKRGELNQLLMHAARAGCVDLVQHILDSGADINAEGEDTLGPLKAALSRANIRVGRDINIHSGRPLAMGATIALLTRLSIAAGTDLGSLARAEHHFRSVEKRVKVDYSGSMTQYEWQVAYFYAVVCHCDIETIRMWGAYGARADLQCSGQGSVLDFARDMARCNQRRPERESYSRVLPDVNIGRWDEIVAFLETLPGAVPEISIDVADDEDWFFDRSYHYDAKMERSYTRGQKDMPENLTIARQGLNMPAILEAQKSEMTSTP